MTPIVPRADSGLWLMVPLMQRGCGSEFGSGIIRAIAHTLETDAQTMSNTQLEQQLASHPAKVQNQIIRINTDARHRALQIALLIPILAGGLGLLNSFRMMRLRPRAFRDR